MGMSKGPQSTVNRYLQSLIPDPNKVRTSEFAGTLMNAVPTFCSISAGIKGYTTTLATGVNAGLGALTYGYEIIRQELQPQVIVGGADENFGSISIYMQSMNKKMNLTLNAEDFHIYSKGAKGYIPGEGASMLLLEDMQHAKDRNAKIYAEIVGYGKANDNSFFDEEHTKASESIDISDRSNALITAIERALKEARINPKDIDLVCGSSDGNKWNDATEITAIRNVFQTSLAEIPVVNYNAIYGFVESSVGLLNISIVVNIMCTGVIPPIPYTCNFIADDVNFITTPTKKNINYALITGSSEGGNHYAIIIRRMF